jgi:hypothetical protein
MTKAVKSKPRRRKKRKERGTYVREFIGLQVNFILYQL